MHCKKILVKLLSGLNEGLLFQIFTSVFAKKIVRFLNMKLQLLALVVAAALAMAEARAYHKKDFFR